VSRTLPLTLARVLYAGRTAFFDAEKYSTKYVHATPPWRMRYYVQSVCICNYWMMVGRRCTQPATADKRTTHKVITAVPLWQSSASAACYRQQYGGRSWRYGIPQYTRDTASWTHGIARNTARQPVPHYRIPPRKVSPGRQFSGKNLPRPADAREGRIFTGETFQGGGWSYSGETFLGHGDLNKRGKYHFHDYLSRADFSWEDILMWH